jgi:hypothetical protein
MIPLQTTPAYQDPEMVAGAHHQSWLAHVMDKVGSILGGDTTLHVTKKADGSVEVTHDPSTEGEKWGRVAAAALGGAAKGLAVGQGPGGPARAAAAGIQSGLQAPQQRLDQANQEASVEQQRIQSHANLVLTQQRSVAQVFQNKMANVAATQAQVDQANAENERFSNAPGAENMGTYGDMDEVAKSPNVAFIMQHHPGGTMRTVPIFDKDHNITGVRAYVIDKAWADQRNDKPVTYLEAKAADTPGGKPTFETKTIPAGAHLNSEIDTILNKQNADNLKVNADYAKAQETAKKEASEEDLRKQQIATGKATAAAHYAAAGASSAEAGLHQAQTEALKGGTPGGTPQIVTDPNFPPAANFDKGTEGINPMPKGGYKIPADTQKAARLSRNIQHNGAVINEIMTRRPDLVGTINSLGTNWQTKVTGTDDKDLAALSGAVDQLAIASAGAHGSRAYKLVEGIHDGVLNHFKNGPDAIKAYVNGQMSSVQTFIDEENNYRHYGDPVGPSTAARADAVKKAPANPAATPPAAAAPAAATGNVSQAAVAPGAAAPPINLIPAGHDVSFKNHGGVWRNVNGVAQKVRDN